MKILVLLFSPPTGSWGSLTRVLAIADAAIQKGHQVAFCASGYLAARLEKNGYRVFKMPPATMFGLPKPVSRLIESRSQKSALPIRPGRSFGSIWFVLRLSGMSGYTYLKKLTAAEINAIDRFVPDVLFTEIDPGAFLSTRITGKKLVSTYASVMRKGTGTHSWKRLYRSMNKILKEYGINDPVTIGLFPDDTVVKIIPSIPALEEGIPNTPEYVYTGYLLKSFKTSADDIYELEEGRRYVFVYVSTGSLSIDKLIRVLPKVFPGPIFERRFNARMVQESGAGIFAELPDFSPEWLRKTLEKRKMYLEKARSLGKIIASYRGADTAISVMEQITDST